jgi:hypothetical protein
MSNVTTHQRSGPQTSYFRRAVTVLTVREFETGSPKVGDAVHERELKIAFRLSAAIIGITICSLTGYYLAVRDSAPHALSVEQLFSYQQPK